MSNYQAQCQCGEVKVSFDAEPAFQLVCHCQQCRDFAQRDFSPLVFFKQKNTQIKAQKLDAEEVLADSGNTVTRQACAQCKTPLFELTSGFPTIIGVHADIFSSEFSFEENFHVWTQDKCAHITLPENTKLFEKGAG